MSYRLLAMDIDGTVLNSEKVITPRTEAAIRAAIAAGKDVFFATGRSPMEVKKELSAFPEMNYAMFVSGALVRDLKTGETVHSVHIPFPIVEKILDIGEKSRGFLGIYAGNNVYAEKKYRGHMGEYGCKCFEELYERCTIWVDDLREAAQEHREEVHKINFYFGNEEDYLACGEELKKLPVTRASGIPHNDEVSPCGVNKGEALLAMCEKLGIPVSETIAVGDQTNDLEMIRAAGLGVAMGNATEEVKAAADVITADCDHDGVAEIIEKYLLET